MVRGRKSLRGGKEEEESDDGLGLRSSSSKKKKGLVEGVAVGEVLRLNGVGPCKPRKYSRLRQQELGVTTFLLTTKRVIVIFFSLATLLIPLGVIFLGISRTVVEVVLRYDDKCWDQWALRLNSTNSSSSLSSSSSSSWSFLSQRRDLSLSADRDRYIRDATTPKTCNLSVVLTRTMKKPIFVYYEIFGFYQNHARYVRSVSAAQLEGANLTRAQLSDCGPRAFVDERTETGEVRPCGLIAWSGFNDTYSIHVDGSDSVDVNATGIAWKTDKVHRFGRVEAINLNTYPSTRGGATSTGFINQDERLMIWMRIAATHRFRKLWGRINDRDLSKGSNLTVQIENQFNTYSFEGEKRVILSTASWLGGASKFIGLAYLTVGCLALLFALLFFFANWRWPRPLGDPSYLSWNRNPLGSSSGLQTAESL